jgi:uncharacterized protein YggE
MRIARLTLPLVTALCACSPAQTQQAAGLNDRHTISVSGEALVSVAPDRIIVTFGIDTRNINLLTAKQQNDRIAKAALATIATLGVEDKDIQTDHLSINQRFESRGGEQVFTGYTVRNMFAVTLTDPVKVDALISGALASGVNHLLNVDFRTSELKQHREQARELAVKAAREKAEKMAAAIGANVGPPISINEGQRYFSPSYYSSWSGASWGNLRGDNIGQSQNVSDVSGGDAAEAIALGKVAVRASVSVSFELTR